MFRGKCVVMMLIYMISATVSLGDMRLKIFLVDCFCKKLSICFFRVKYATEMGERMTVVILGIFLWKCHCVLEYDCFHLLLHPSLHIGFVFE